MARVLERLSADASNQIINKIPTRLWIGGKWIDGSDGHSIAVSDPATEQVIAEVASASASDVVTAIDAAAAAADVAAPIDAGVVGINLRFISDPAAPFGGMKQSGIGREGAANGIHEFLEPQYIAVDW